MHRRDFLARSAAAGMAAAAPWRLWAAPSGGHGTRLLLVFLRGAYDALGAFVPYTDAFYREARPRLALDAPGSGAVARSCIDLDGRWGLLPRLGDTVGALWAESQFSFVPFAGTGFVSRSHFDAQDRMEAGAIAGATPPGGFLGRLLAELGPSEGGSGIAFAAQAPQVLRGERAVTTLALGTGTLADGELQHLAQVLSLYQGHALEAPLREALQLRSRPDDALIGADMPSARAALTAEDFARQCAVIGRLLRERPAFSVATVDVGGWDTHARQGGAEGPLASRLERLSEGIVSLRGALGDAAWRNTVVVVLSEFGRTVRENGAQGTDHGHGSALWIAGGQVRGGRAAGEQVPIRPDQLHQGRDLPVLNEYGAVMGGLLRRAYGLDTAALARIFPGRAPVDLGLL